MVSCIIAPLTYNRPLVGSDTEAVSASFIVLVKLF